MNRIASYVLISISFIVFSGMAVMHKDLVLHLDSRNNITGLPRKYKPATFDITANKLRIRKTEVVFPECITSYLDQFEDPEVRLTGSWYHQSGNVPHYIKIRFTELNSDVTISLLISLETLELLGITKIIKDGTTTHRKKEDWEQECVVQFNQSIQKVSKHD